MHRLPPPRTVHSSPVNARRLRSPPRAALPIPAPTSSTRRDAFGTSARSRPPANCKTPPMARQWCMGKFPPSLPGCERPPVFIDSSTVCTQLRVTMCVSFRCDGPCMEAQLRTSDRHMKEYCRCSSERMKSLQEREELTETSVCISRTKRSKSLAYPTPSTRLLGGLHAGQPPIYAW